MLNWLYVIIWLLSKGRDVTEWDALLESLKPRPPVEPPPNPSGASTSSSLPSKSVALGQMD